VGACVCVCVRVFRVVCVVCVVCVCPCRWPVRFHHVEPRRCVRSKLQGRSSSMELPRTSCETRSRSVYHKPKRPMHIQFFLQFTNLYMGIGEHLEAYEIGQQLSIISAKPMYANIDLVFHPRTQPSLSVTNQCHQSKHCIDTPAF
jgi:hypothetical protein